METVKRFFYRCSGYLGAVSTIGFIVIIGICVIDVFLDKLFSMPIQGTYELIERSMVIAVFASFAYAQTKKAHINMMILLERFARLPRLILLGFTSVLSVGTTGYAAYAAWMQSRTAASMATMTGVLHIPLWPFFVLQSVAMFLFAVILTLDTIYVFAAIKNDRINDLIIEDYNMLIRGKKAKKIAG